MSDEVREFKVNLAQLEDLTARIRGFKEFASGYLAELDNKANALGSMWTGQAAAAYAEAHREWAVGAADVQDGLQAVQDATVRARESYAGAVTTNLRMLGR